MSDNTSYYVDRITRPIFGTDLTNNGTCSVLKKEAHTLWGAECDDKDLYKNNECYKYESTWNETLCPVSTAIDMCVTQARDICQIAFSETNQKDPNLRPISKRRINCFVFLVSIVFLLGLYWSLFYIVMLCDLLVFIGLGF